jgi:hypothetical protein
VTDDAGRAEPAPLAFPNGMGTVAPRALALAGYTDLRACSAATARELLTIHGVGPKAIRMLREAMAAEGLAFRDEAPRR